MVEKFRSFLNKLNKFYKSREWPPYLFSLLIRLFHLYMNKAIVWLTVFLWSIVRIAPTIRFYANKECNAFYIIWTHQLKSYLLSTPNTAKLCTCWLQWQRRVRMKYTRVIWMKIIPWKSWHFYALCYFIPLLWIIIIN